MNIREIKNVGASIARPAVECYEFDDSSGKYVINSAGRPMAAPTIFNGIFAPFHTERGFIIVRRIRGNLFLLLGPLIPSLGLPFFQRVALHGAEDPLLQIGIGLA